MGILLLKHSLKKQKGGIGKLHSAQNIYGEPRPSLWGHVQIARVDHWFKNVFVFPGIVIAPSLDPAKATSGLALRICEGLLSICLVASSNYVINEVLDGPSDCQHPIKSSRPVPSGRVSILFAYV